MRRRYDIDVMATLPLEADHYARYMLTGDLVAPSALTYVIVLAIFAGKVAVGNKDGTGTVAPDQRRFFTEMGT
jgi:hypothetical protein